MIRIPSGSFHIGSDSADPEERPRRTVIVDSFLMDEWPVTNADFREFVQATSYMTTAEALLDPLQYPAVPAECLKPGSLCFYPTLGGAGLGG